MQTVTELAKQFNLSRSTILYYERIGLLTPNFRSENGYRWYGEKEISKLASIVAYRAFGMAIAEIKPLLNQTSKSSQSQLLKDQFYKLEQEINKLRKQQEAIVATLKEPGLLEEKMVTKQRWVAIMRASGFSDDDMKTWHKNFEAMEPKEHQKFLQSLGIDDAEISKIRAL